MTIEAAVAAPAPGRALPVAAMLLALLAVWYGAAVFLNAPMQIDRFEREQAAWTASDLVAATLRMERPLLPAPHQIAAEMKQSLFDLSVTSKRSLAYHSWVTLSSTLLGFVIGSFVGLALAAGIVHVRTLEKSLMPWVISSQTIPILAIAPMIVVVLGAIGLKGLVPKAIISTYLCFFPVAIGMVKGLRSPDTLQLDLMRTYNATRWQTFRLLRWPAAVPFLFASLKVAIAISLVGAGENVVSLPAYPERIKELQDKGGPVGFYCPDLVPLELSRLAVFRGSPGMNGAKLYVNWLLSKEGQIAQLAVFGTPPVHKDLQRPEFHTFPDEIAGKEIISFDDQHTTDRFLVLWNKYATAAK